MEKSNAGIGGHAFGFFVVAFIVVFSFVFYSIMAHSQASAQTSSTSSIPSSTSTVTTVYAVSNVTLNSSVGLPVIQYDFNTNHTYILGENVSPVNLSVGDAIIGTPTIYKGLLLVTTMGNLTELQRQRYDLTTGSLIAIDMKNNSIVWRDNFPDQIMSQPITAGSVIVIGMGNNQEVPPQYYNLNNGIFGVNLTNGKILWNFTTPAAAMTTPALYDGNIFEVSMMGVLYVLNATTGNEVANTSIELPDLLSSPLLNDGTLYFGGSYSAIEANGSRSNHGAFFAINATTHNITWSTSFENASAGLNDACAVFYKGTVISAYLAESVYANPTLAAMNATTGKVLWELNETKVQNEVNVSNGQFSGFDLNFTENAIAPLVLWHGMVLSDSNFLGILFAVNATTGKPVWAVNTGQGEGPPNIVNDAYAVTLSDGGVLYVINATTGSIVKSIETGIPHLSSQPVVTNNYVIITGMNGQILSIPVNTLIG